MVLVYSSKFKASLGYVEKSVFEREGGKRREKEEEKKCPRECRSLEKTSRILGGNLGTEWDSGFP